MNVQMYVQQFDYGWDAWVRDRRDTCCVAEGSGPTREAAIAACMRDLEAEITINGVEPMMTGGAK